MGTYTIGETAAVLADAHIRPGESVEDLSRVEAFGRYCLRHRIPNVFLLGDWFDFLSCADYLEEGDKARLGLTVRKDLLAGVYALKLMEAIWEEYNAKERRAGRSWNQYLPRKVLCKGNHDIRPAKKGKRDMTLNDEYTIRYIDEDFLDRGWEVYQFLDVFKWNGIRFSHYFASGQKRTPCPITQAAKNIGRSAVWGHSHKFEKLSRQVEKGGERDIFVSCPAFLPAWRLEKDEDNGFLVITDACEGNFAISHVSYEYLMNNYSEDVKVPRRAA